MDRARIDDVKIGIKDLSKKQQENVLAIAKTHGVSKRFLEVIAEPKKEESIVDMIQLYIDEIKENNER